EVAFPHLAALSDLSSGASFRSDAQTLLTRVNRPFSRYVVRNMSGTKLAAVSLRRRRFRV
ncbi:MAG TPA: hypothetical protein VFZ04_15670, partial [Longimicrobiales bacterium]